ncbi:hypothetical protein GCM10018773_05310 [Streptomyces candidus]|nr:hypothetical protein GCM10018773_05310 [Streptomyces candidus]
MSGEPDEDVWCSEFLDENVAAGLPAAGRAEVDRIVQGLLDLASLRMEAGHDYDEQNPMKLRTIGTDRLLLWCQKVEHRAPQAGVRDPDQPARLTARPACPTRRTRTPGCTRPRPAPCR